MKQIFLKVLKDGTTTSNVSSLIFDGENLTTKVSIDYSNVDFSDWIKQADIFVGQTRETDYVYTSEVGNVLEFTLEEGHLVKGYLRIQPLVKRLEEGSIYSKQKWETIELKVKKSLNVLEDDISITQSIAEQWEIRIEAVEQEELTRQSNEGTRVTNENTRISNENTRISQESSRVSAENTRVTQENARNVFVAYNPLTPYVVGNKVSHNGSSYVCILDSLGNLPTNTTYWLLIAQKGEQGIQGIQGIQGLKGNQWKGAYSSVTNYVVDDVVSYNGSSYICILASLNNLPTNATYFSLFAQKGDNTTADAVTNTPSGNISSTTVQDAINELDTEKVDKTDLSDNGVEFGGIQNNGNNNAILIERTMSGVDKFGHAIADDSIIDSTNTGAYASFDSDYSVIGATNYNHMTGFQARPTYNGSGTMSQAAGFTADLQHSGVGTINNYIGVKINKPVKLSTGGIDVLYGIFIDALAEGNTNLAIYSLADALSYFKGAIQSDSTLQGSNFYTDSEKINLGIGIGIVAKSVAAYYNTIIGSAAGASLSSDANYNALIGAQAGNGITTGTGNICIGAKAGLQGNGSNNLVIGNNAAYWSIGSGNVLLGNGAGKYLSGANNQFIVTNEEKADGAHEITDSLMYGNFDSTLANQFLSVNGDFRVSKDLILKSPNGTLYALRVSDAGVLSVVAV